MKLCSAWSSVFRLGSHWGKLLLGTAHWISQNHRFAIRAQCLTKDRHSGRTEQVCKAKSQPDLLKSTPEFPADKVINLPVLGLLPGAGDSADGVS